MLAIIGSYATNMSIADVKIMAIAGVLGLIFSACKFDSAALILGLVLGVICEGNFSRAFTIARGSFATMFYRPVAGTIMVISILLLVWPFISQLFKRNKD